MMYKFGAVQDGGKVLFNGESEPVPINRYYRLSTYTPIVGDQVLFLVDENTNQYILQGKVIKS